MIEESVAASKQFNKNGKLSLVGSLCLCVGYDMLCDTRYKNDENIRYKVYVIMVVSCKI